MATQDMQSTPPAGGNPQGGAQGDAGAPAPDQGQQQGQGDLSAQVVFRFYKSGFVTVSSTGDDEEPIQSLDDAVSILASVAQANLPGGQEGGKPQGQGEPDNDEGGGGFAKGFKKAGGGMGGKGMMQ